MRSQKAIQVRADAKKKRSLRNAPCSFDLNTSNSFSLFLSWKDLNFGGVYAVPLCEREVADAFGGGNAVGSDITKGSDDGVVWLCVERGCH